MVETQPSAEQPTRYYLASFGTDYSNSWLIEGFGPASYEECANKAKDIQALFDQLNAKALDIVMRYAINWCQTVMEKLPYDKSCQELFTYDLNVPGKQHLEWLCTQLQSVIDEHDGFDFKLLRLFDVLKQPEKTFITRDDYGNDVNISDFTYKAENEVQRTTFAYVIANLKPKHFIGLRSTDAMPHSLVQFTSQIETIVDNTGEHSVTHYAFVEILALMPKAWQSATYPPTPDTSEFVALTPFEPSCTPFEITEASIVDEFDFTPCM